jgi:hypothetical protein
VRKKKQIFGGKKKKKNKTKKKKKKKEREIFDCLTAERSRETPSPSTCRPPAPKHRPSSRQAPCVHGWVAVSD